MKESTIIKLLWIIKPITIIDSTSQNALRNIHMNNYFLNEMIQTDIILPARSTSALISGVMATDSLSKH